MFASCAPCNRLAQSAAPLAFSVVAFVEALVVAEKAGLNGSEPQPITENAAAAGVLVAPDVELSVVSVLSGPQLVGLNRKLSRVTATLSVRSRSGMALKIVGSVLVAITRPLCGSTPIVARVVSRPRSNGPASASTGIDRP